MLVGNHDQVSVGGLDHALQPLAAACSAIHILDVPTLYRSAITQFAKPMLQHCLPSLCYNFTYNSMSLSAHSQV